jgi:hypothetical protein
LPGEPFEDPLPVIGASAPKHTFADATTDLPVKKREFGVHRNGDARTCAIDQPPYVVDQSFPVSTTLMVKQSDPCSC